MRLTLALLFSVILVLASGRPLAGQDLSKGEELYQSRQYEQAEGALRGAVAAEPDNARAHYLLGMTLLELKKTDEAQAEITRAGELGHAADQVKVATGRVHLQRQQFDEALAALNEAAQANADNKDVYLYRGVVYANRNEFQPAVQDLEKAVQMSPENPMAHYYAGLAYNGVRRPDKMVEHFQIFLKLAPDAPEAARVRSLLRNVR
jgi:tetratricopeptide (TPR) repeat protein